MVTLNGHNWYWACDVVCTHAELLLGLERLANKDRQIILEGATKEVSRLLAKSASKPLTLVESGFTWFGKPKFVAITMIRENMAVLRETVEKHPGPQAFIHCIIVAEGQVLMEAYDAGNGVVHFSQLCTTPELAEFARFMKVELRREELQ